MQTIHINNYLNFIPYSLFELWDTKRYTSKSITSTFDIVSLGSCIKEESKKYKLFQNPDEDFGILGVNNQDGIFDAYTQKGKDINQAYKKMKVGWLAYNPYRINVGSIGIRKLEHKNDYISPAYVVFSCNEKLLPEFLFLIFKTDTFSKIINESTTGSVRQNLTIDILKSLQIPLPSINEQQNLVKNYFAKIKEAEILNKEANDLEEVIEKYFLEQLRVGKIEAQVIKKGLQIIQYSHIDRWDVWVNKINNNKSNLRIIPFQDIVIGKPMYGANVKGVKTVSDVRYIRITDINENGTLNDEFVSPEFVEYKYELKENDFLIARSGNTVGKTFLYKKKYGKAIYAGYLVKYNIDYSKVIPEYLLEYTKSYTFKNWVASNQRVSGQPNINGQEYLQAPIIIPEIPKQQEIVKYSLEQKEKIKKLQFQAEQLKNQAQQEFEKGVFS